MQCFPLSVAGTSTWLTFVTLTHSTGSDELPKVNYVTYIDIWFLVCTVFIFASLMEFAFVNTISRIQYVVQHVLPEKPSKVIFFKWYQKNQKLVLYFKDSVIQPQP